MFWNLSLTIARPWGIPVRLHWTLLLASPFIAHSFGWMLLVGLFASIVLHELGHSWVALKKGCRVREILLLPIGGAARMERMPRRPRDEVIMALAGPAVSLGIGILLLGSTIGFILSPWGKIADEWPSFFGLLQRIAIINIGLTAFNLIPSFPMDGGRVLRALLVRRKGRLKATLIAARVGKISAVVFGVIALFDWPESMTLLIIALFIFWSADAEYRLVQREEFYRQWAGIPEDDGDLVIVSPPPYSKESESKTELRPYDHQP